MLTKEKKAFVYTREEVSELILLVSTDNGAFLYYSDADRLHWDINGPHFLGSKIHHLILDPRDNKTLLASVESKSNGQMIYKSIDFGKTWDPARKPPEFPKDKLKRKVNHTFHLAPGHDTEPDVWYAGTSPQGLFRSNDGGEHWKSLNGFNKNIKWEDWTSYKLDVYPKTPKIHSILIDPNDKRHIYIAMSYGGVFETLDQCNTWEPLNDGLKSNHLKQTNSKFGYDPHSITFHPFKPQCIFQQNHFGIYKIDRPNTKWERIGDNMPSDVGDIGFPIAIHPNDPNTIWVFPIDANKSWPRVSPGGQPAIYSSQDSGESWFRQDIGLPMRNAWFTVLRQCLTTDNLNNAGLYFGTTSGAIWMSDNEGNSWRQIAINLPRILAIQTGIILKK
tara:strand:- start:1171 stop:2340 length:1170 start_codon:yes stop_codon:yes gene_type:complete